MALVSCEFMQPESDLKFEDLKLRRGEQATKVDFNTVRNQVLVPHCVECHSGYMNYATVFAERNRIYRSIETGRMPKDRPQLAASLQAIVKDWIDGGAIRDNTNPDGNLGKMPTGLSPKMLELYKIHKENHPILDKEKTLVLDTSGKQTNINLKEGREGQLQYGLSKSRKILFKLEMTENTCGEFLPRVCLYAAHIKQYQLRFAFTKHPDPKKVGKVVEASFDGGDPSSYDFQAVEESTFMAANMGMLSKKLDRQVQDYIVCEDWSWLPSESTQINSWGVERMLVNAESELNENRVVGGLYDFKLKKFDQYVYQMTPPKFLDSKFGRQSIAPLIGDAGSFYYQAGDKQCSVTFKIDSNAFVSDVQTETDKVKFQPYHAGQDNLYDEKATGTYFSYLMSLVREGVVR